MYKHRHSKNKCGKRILGNIYARPKTNRGQDVLLFICSSCVAEKPDGCLYKLTLDNAKFHSPFIFISLNQFHLSFKCLAMKLVIIIYYIIYLISS